MAATVPDKHLVGVPVSLPDARRALEVLVPRLATLVRGTADPNAPAMGTWSVAELATHLTHVFGVLPGLATGETASSPLQQFWDLGQVTKDLVADEPERDLAKLADRIEGGFRGFMEASAAASGDESRPWLVEGLTTDVRTFHCHMLNEVIVHGYDIAQASKQPWPVEPAHATLVLQGFIVPVIGMLGRTVVDQENAARLQACYDIRLRGAGRVFFVFADGDLTPEPPSARRVDCHISADPAEMLLVVWKRKSQWGPIGRLKMTAWGRRPWLAFRLPSLLVNP
jgi:uncharacterized protein (TIGR03083 family)